MNTLSIRPRNSQVVLARLKEKYKELDIDNNGDKKEVIIKFKDHSNIKYYKSTDTIVFTNRDDDYYELRELDLRSDKEHVDVNVPTSPLLSELNFEHKVVGSDETGKGEIFRPLIVTATYMNGEKDVLKYMKMFVNDSKQVKGKVNEIGFSLTGINSWEQLEGKTWIANDLFATRIVTNEIYNRKCYENGGISENILHSLQTEAHLEVLSELYRRHKGATIVVDDFDDGKRVEEFRTELCQKENSIVADNIYLTTKGDGKNMAVALASVISRYFSELFSDYVSKVANEHYKRNDVEKIVLPNGAKIDQGIDDLRSQFKPELVDEFFDIYSKKYYKNVQ